MTADSTFAGDDRGPARLEAFSDGVTAIAITLLVLEIGVPEFDQGGGETLWDALADLWPSYLGYVLSFFILGIIWANHHAIFKHIHRVNHHLVLLNLCTLFIIGFFPFPTALLSEYLTHDGQRTAVIVYAGCNFLAAFLFFTMWWYARRAGLIAPDTDQGAVGRITQRFRVGPPVYFVAFAAAFLSAWASLSLLAALSVFYFLPESVQSPIIDRMARTVRRNPETG